MNHAQPPQDGVSKLIVDDSQILLRVTRDHAISEDWLTEHEPDLYTAWRTAGTPGRRDEIADHLEHRFAATEGADVRAADESRLIHLIDDYEARLIGSGAARRSLPEHRSHLDAHIEWNKLGRTPAAVDLRLRDWAEIHTPALLTAWQRAVLIEGHLSAGAQRMADIAAAHRQAADKTRAAPTTPHSTTGRGPHPAAEKCGSPISFLAARAGRNARDLRPPTGQPQLSVIRGQQAPPSPPPQTPRR